MDAKIIRDGAERLQGFCVGVCHALVQGVQVGELAERCELSGIL